MSASREGRGGYIFINKLCKSLHALQYPLGLPQLPQWAPFFMRSVTKNCYHFINLRLMYLLSATLLYIFFGCLLKTFYERVPRINSWWESAPHQLSMRECPASTLDERVPRVNSWWESAPRQLFMRECPASTLYERVPRVNSWWESAPRQLLMRECPVSTLDERVHRVNSWWESAPCQTVACQHTWLCPNVLARSHRCLSTHVTVA